MTRLRTPLLYLLASVAMAMAAWRGSASLALLAAVAIAAVVLDGALEWRSALSETKAHREAADAAVAAMRADVDELRKEFRGWKNVRAIAK